MLESLADPYWQNFLTLAVVFSTTLSIILVTLPSIYSNFEIDEVTEDTFTTADRDDPQRSGYDYFGRHKDAQGKLNIECTVHVVVLGDIGRSPRMQYHALSIASHGGRVDLVGYVDSEVHPDVQRNRFIRVVPIAPMPRQLQTSNKLAFLFIAPLKILWQIWSLYYALGYRTKASKWMLVQNPPSIPTLALAQFVGFFRSTRLVIDWHNFGYSLLAIRLGARHPFAKLSKWYEGFFSQGAAAHFAVTNAMTRKVKSMWNVDAMALHDRPPQQFQPLTKQQRLEFLWRLPETSCFGAGLEDGTWKLIVSSTSWTADEDFDLLLEALVDYSAAVANGRFLPRIVAIITGKGPLKEYYLGQIQQLNRNEKLQNVVISTAWLSPADYASLLGSADLGISLHTSSSGVDLPMKVVDMFGTGLPVAGWSKFEAWPELVQEDKNGCGFGSAAELAELLKDLFGSDSHRLELLREGAIKECERRWDDEWMPVAGQLFQLKP